MIQDRLAYRLLAIAFAIAATLACARAANSQCAGGRCPPPRRPFVPELPARPAFEWRLFPGDPDRAYLFKDGVTAGAWCYREKHYRAYDPAAGAWGEPTQASPFQPPARRGVPDNVAAARPQQDAFPEEQLIGQLPEGGVDTEKLRESGRQYTRGGREISRRQAFEAFEKLLPDDADHLRLTHVGPRAQGERHRKALAEDAALSAWKGKVSFQSYESADAPMLRGLGFAAGLQVQAPGGRPLNWCAADAGPDELARCLEVAQARRKDPNWDPLKWPDLARPAPAPAPDAGPAAGPGGDPKYDALAGGAIIVLISGIICLASLLLHKKGV